MKSLYLVFRASLSANHIDSLMSIKIILQRYRHNFVSDNLFVSEAAVEKFNHALILLVLLLRGHANAPLDVDIKDLLSISADLAYFQRSITCHTPIHTITLYRIIGDQICSIHNIIDDFIGVDS
ncbi:MAG: hypothetical protein WC297_03535 [Candidatus Paceibacterota bacterium]|jgi:hypothetical protein